MGSDGRQSHGQQAATSASQGVGDIVALLCGHCLDCGTLRLLLLCLGGGGEGV